jgi:hypothetical protein
MLHGVTTLGANLISQHNSTTDSICHHRKMAFLTCIPYSLYDDTILKDTYGRQVVVASMNSLLSNSSLNLAVPNIEALTIRNWP